MGNDNARIILEKKCFLLIKKKKKMYCNPKFPLLYKTPWLHCWLSFVFQQTTNEQGRRRRAAGKTEGQTKDVGS